MSTHSDDDLFRPTLTEADDAVDFDRPWNPWTLVVLSFFFGLPAGGGLLAFNFRRLGIRERLYPTLGIVALATGLMAAVRLWLSGANVIDLQDRELSRAVRFGSQALSCVIAMVIAAPQHRRFRLYEASGQPQGKLLWPALAAIGISLSVAFVEAGLRALQIFVLRS